MCNLTLNSPVIYNWHSFDCLLLCPYLYPPPAKENEFTEERIVQISPIFEYDRLMLVFFEWLDQSVPYSLIVRTEFTCVVCQKVYCKTSSRSFVLEVLCLQ
jgi:hypothetical protein